MDPMQQMGMTAQMDQAEAGVKAIAGLLGSYFKALRAEGFTRAEAHAIVLDYQCYILTQGKRDD
jgi:hypothetical protein